MRYISRFAALCLTVVLLQGCDSNSITSQVDDQDATFSKQGAAVVSNLVVVDNPKDYLASGQFAICKLAPEDPSAVFDFDVTIETKEDAVFQIKHGECVTVADVIKERLVGITERDEPGWMLDGDVLIYNIDEDGVITEMTHAGPHIEGVIGEGKDGCVAVYTNRKVPTGGEGCTPGAWKNRLLRIGAWAVAGYSPDQTIKSAFSEAASTSHGDKTLLEALSLQGGNSFDEKVEILLRAGTAALLNAAHPGTDYDYTPAQVIAMVNAAIATGDGDAVVTLAGELDVLNNQGCDITSGS